MPYALVVTGPASTDLSERLPEAAAAAAIELITGPLIDNPQRIGAPLRDEYDGLWSARLALIIHENSVEPLLGVFFAFFLRSGRFEVLLGASWVR